jgi:hypothetical protein
LKEEVVEGGGDRKQEEVDVEVIREVQGDTGEERVDDGR